MRYDKRQYNFKVRDRVYQGGTHIMAIINATPDSFYSPSRLCDNAVETAKKFVLQGAEILDIGGQSTRPDAVRLSSIEEMSRVLPVLEAVRSECKDIPISIDTFYPDVAKVCIDYGADMINDVSCLAYDGMQQVIVDNDVSICVMHDRRNSQIADLFFDKQMGLESAIRKLENAGVKRDRIMLDGGIGFNKSKDEDWQLLNGYESLLDDFEDLPFLLGTSRKSMFGGDVQSRLSKTLDSTMLAAKMGVLFVRVHDVYENKAVVDMCKK